ncbi:MULTISPECIES: L,D-transpeptidase family protein [Streptomyces]|uniref:L,D-transpeptidase family protein n=1 Tax=Streptomyces TaxID=1883 RepID=UPI000A83B77B|nr:MULTISPECIES: L,D-transpeptidase family protein [Streptomyces]MDH6223084.1 hypothetical protein [Streptomyces sp. MJP52]
MRNLRKITATTAVAVSTATLALAAPAAAAPVGTAAVGYSTRLIFDKNPADPSNSRLYWRVYRVEDNGRQRKIVDVSWRAGSGIGVKNDCTRNKGWLPNGSYDITLHPSYNGSIIKGVAFRLNNKKCSAGTTTRTDLFIHSEMTRSGGQNRNVESQRWDGNGDYKSNGCIKLKPADIKSLASHYKRYHPASRTVTAKLTVVS